MLSIETLRPETTMKEETRAEVEGYGADSGVLGRSVDLVPRMTSPFPPSFWDRSIDLSELVLSASKGLVLNPSLRRILESGFALPRMTGGLRLMGRMMWEKEVDTSTDSGVRLRLPQNDDRGGG
jgi:hypothetical protein